MHAPKEVAFALVERFLWARSEAGRDPAEAAEERSAMWLHWRREAWKAHNAAQPAQPAQPAQQPPPAAE